MRVLVLFAHPCEESFAAALHDTVVRALRAGGHEVDDCDLYAEKFQPILTTEERRVYHDVPGNRSHVAGYVDRLRRAEALVLVFPVWNFGFPAILKGFFDRVFLPGVSFDLVDGKSKGALGNIRRLVAVTSYGGSRLRAILVGDPPRRVVKRAVRAAIHPFARCRYLAYYDMNRTTAAGRARFLARVETAMARL
jgi:NAD(P)H dehydrogenase (quinone)